MHTPLKSSSNNWATIIQITLREVAGLIIFFLLHEGANGRVNPNVMIPFSCINLTEVKFSKVQCTLVKSPIVTIQPTYATLFCHSTPQSDCKISTSQVELQ
ncbi:unnamed protein product [Musa acuminata subsp. burmannicoides]